MGTELINRMMVLDLFSVFLSIVALLAATVAFRRD